MAPIWKAPADANCNSKISIFKYTLQFIPGEKHFPPFMGTLTEVLRKKVESVLLNERKFVARSSSPWSVRSLPAFSVSCCAAFPWAQVRARDKWNGKGKRQRLMAVVVYHLLYSGYSQGYNLYMQVPSRLCAPSGPSSCRKPLANRSPVLTFGVAQTRTNTFLARGSKPQVLIPSLDVGVGKRWLLCAVRLSWAALNTERGDSRAVFLAMDLQ